MSESQAREIRRLKEKLKTVTEARNTLQERLKQEDHLWSSKDNGARHNTPRSARDMHMLEVLEDMTSTDAKLLAITGITKEEFDHVLKDTTEYIGDYPDYSRLYRDSAKRSRDPGNRCTLYIRHAVLLAMYYQRHTVSQRAISAFFGIHQSNVSREINAMHEILSDILPTPKAISINIENMTNRTKQRSAIPGDGGGTIIIDGTHTKVERPQDAERRREVYTGRKKTCTYNTTVVSNLEGVIIALGNTCPGTTNDLTMLKDDQFLLDGIIDDMQRTDIAEKDRINVYTDAGYLGIIKHLPGINSWQPHKRKKGKKLAPEQKRHNRGVNNVRIAIEHGIGRMKKYEIARGPYWGDEDELNSELNVVAGLVNLHVMWQKIKNGTAPWYLKPIKDGT